MDKVGIVIQARSGSTRLPGKILKEINDRTLLDHIIDRLTELKQEATVVIATSDLERDDIVEEWCKKKKVNCFRGDENNVLKRYYDCMIEYGFNYVVRMTGDNPFPDVEELDRMIEMHIREDNDFSECHSVLPIGVGMEMFSRETLIVDMENASMPHHFEHVDEYVLENLDKFKWSTLKVPEEKAHPEIRLTVDTEEDYKKACYIAEKSKTGLPTTTEAIKLCMEYV